VKLKGYIKEIIGGAVAQQRDPMNGLVRNYIDDEAWFGEVSGSVILAASVYRMAVHALVLISNASRGRRSQEKRWRNVLTKKAW
jgi:hypothetical protein